MYILTAALSHKAPLSACFRIFTLCGCFCMVFCSKLFLFVLGKGCHCDSQWLEKGHHCVTVTPGGQGRDVTDIK